MNKAICFPKANPNPLAPPWLYPSEWTVETPAGYRDEYQMYTLLQALTAGQQVTAVLPTDTAGQCNFYWTHIGVHVYGGAGVPAVLISDSEGHMMSNTRVVLANDGAFGRTDHVTPLPIPHRMVPGSRLTFDFLEIDGAAAVSVQLYIIGFKRWADPDAIAGRGGAGGGE